MFSFSLLSIFLLWWVVSSLLCHGWASISVPNDCTREQSFNAALASILLGSSCRWTWTALKSSLADRFHDQPSQLAVWVIPELNIKRESERGVTLLFCFHVQCLIQRKTALSIPLQKSFQTQNSILGTNTNGISIFKFTSMWLSSFGVGLQVTVWLFVIPFISIFPSVFWMQESRVSQLNIASCSKMTNVTYFNLQWL